MEDSTEIWRLKEGEVTEVKRLCESAHWPYTLRDLERLYRLEPEGWFRAAVRGQYAGQAMGMRIESLGCIGIVIVHPDFRRQGIATALTKAALSYLMTKGIETIKLDATTEGYGIYEKLSFRPEFSILHYVRAQQASAPLEEEDGIEPLSVSHVERVSDFDRIYFGVNRFNVLKAVRADSEGFILMERRKVRGYVMGRPMDYENGYWLGPWVAENRPSAERLLRHVLNRCQNREIRLGVLEENPEAQDLLAKYGFKTDFKITRMRLGPKLEKEDPSGIYAEAGHEKG